MRKTVTIGMVILGFAVQAMSYFWLAATWSINGSPIVSTEPRLQFAPLLFIVGVALVFLAAVAYEVIPSRKSK